jgi:hypothetical protein
MFHFLALILTLVKFFSYISTDLLWVKIEHFMAISDLMVVLLSFARK